MTDIEITDDLIAQIGIAMNNQCAANGASDCVSPCCAPILRDARQEHIKKELNKPFEVNKF